MSTFELVWDSRCGVAESPVWDATSRRLLFCDINGKKINALTVDSGARATWDLPEVVGSFGLCRSGRLVVALRHRVVLFDPRTQAITDLTPAVVEPTTNRLNDGKVGPDGAFWVGSMDENSPRQPLGARMPRVTADGRIEEKVRGLRCVERPRVVAGWTRHVSFRFNVGDRHRVGFRSRDRRHRQRSRVRQIEQ